MPLKFFSGRMGVKRNWFYLGEKFQIWEPELCSGRSFLSTVSFVGFFHASGLIAAGFEGKTLLLIAPPRNSEPFTNVGGAVGFGGLVP